MKKQVILSRRVLCCALIVICQIVLVIVSISSGFSESSKDEWATEAPRARAPAPKGQIEIPVAGSEVSRHFEVFGTLSGTCRHLWLVERIGGRYWPKEPELKPKGGKWNGEVFEGGRPPEGIFELLLVDVSGKTSRNFQTWLETGHRTGRYPGLTVDDLGDKTILDSKTYRLTEK